MFHVKHYKYNIHTEKTRMKSRGRAGVWGKRSVSLVRKLTCSQSLNSSATASSLSVWGRWISQTLRETPLTPFPPPPPPHPCFTSAFQIPALNQKKEMPPTPQSSPHPLIKLSTYFNLKPKLLFVSPDNPALTQIIR